MSEVLLARAVMGFSGVWGLVMCAVFWRVFWGCWRPWKR